MHHSVNRKGQPVRDQGSVLVLTVWKRGQHQPVFFFVMQKTAYEIPWIGQDWLPAMSGRQRAMSTPLDKRGESSGGGIVSMVSQEPPEKEVNNHQPCQDIYTNTKHNYSVPSVVSGTLRLLLLLL